MKIEGQSPLKGSSADKASASFPAKSPAKFGVKGEGKSFGAALDKALGNEKPVGNEKPAGNDNASVIAKLPDPMHPLAPALPTAEPDGPIKKNNISADDAMETIKFRLKSGYYNSKPVNDALTDKLTGFFDELA